MSKDPAIKPKYLLLDTHIWIWLLNGSDELSHKSYLNVIEHYARHDNLRVSAISVWELGMLVAKKRLTLAKDVHLWVKESFKGQGIFLEPLSIDILLESTQFNDDFHGDPADRMLVATASNIKAAVMTADDRIISYCKEHGIMVEVVK